MAGVLQMQTESSIVIKRGLEEVFSVMQDIERWPDFLSSHKNLQIIRKGIEGVMIGWGGIIRWRSIITIDKENKRIKMETLNWPVKGLVGEWRFKEIEEGTEVRVLHLFNSKTPFIHSLLEKLSERIINKMDRDALKGLKEKIE
jgi:ribosome-associated toxin RatA of RatAB toxin-antitoxin module